MLGISWMTEQLLASQGLSSIELVSQSISHFFDYLLKTVELYFGSVVTETFYVWIHV
jgi:hypothetical protein